MNASLGGDAEDAFALTTPWRKEIG